jgi:hypothetical protein
MPRSRSSTDVLVPTSRLKGKRLTTAIKFNHTWAGFRFLRPVPGLCCWRLEGEPKEPRASPGRIVGNRDARRGLTGISPRRVGGRRFAVFQRVDGVEIKDLSFSLGDGSRGARVLVPPGGADRSESAPPAAKPAKPTPSPRHGVSVARCRIAEHALLTCNGATVAVRSCRARDMAVTVQGLPSGERRRPKVLLGTVAGPVPTGPVEGELSRLGRRRVPGVDDSHSGHDDRRGRSRPLVGTESNRRGDEARACTTARDARGCLVTPASIPVRIPGLTDSAPRVRG